MYDATVCLTRDVHVLVSYTDYVMQTDTRLSSPVHTNNNVETTFDFVEAAFDFVAFDNVASTLLRVWTGLKALRHDTC